MIKTHRTIVLAAAGLLLATQAFAASITFSTNVAGTGFGGTSLTLNNSLGAPATLTFIPNANVSTGVPSNVNFGNFTLVCSTCSTQTIGAGSFFAAFTFDLVITDVTDVGSGKFVGSSTGGTVFSDLSQIVITWAPLQLGPGTSNASSGTFGPTIFTTAATTAIVAPNSGAVPGQSTVSGSVAFESVAAPEPSSLALLGCGLVGLGLCRRRKSSRGHSAR